MSCSVSECINILHLHIHSVHRIFNVIRIHIAHILIDFMKSKYAGSLCSSSTVLFFWVHIIIIQLHWRWRWRRWWCCFYLFNYRLSLFLSRLENQHRRSSFDIIKHHKNVVNSSVIFFHHHHYYSLLAYTQRRTTLRYVIQTQCFVEEQKLKVCQFLLKILCHSSIFIVDEQIEYFLPNFR